MGEPLRVGVVGCGSISAQYLTTLAAATEVEVVAVTDLDPARAETVAQTYGTRAVDSSEIYGLDDVEWILNLTTPAWHEEVALTAIANGRSVYTEKPLCASLGAGSRTRDERTITTGPRADERIRVTVDSHVTAILEHASGALSTIVMSFDAPASTAPRIEVHGEAGSMVVPDPNRFDGDVLVHAVGGAWEPVAPTAGYVGAGRGCGLIDVARSHDRRTGRATAGLGFHVLDTMETVLRSASEHTRLPVASTCTVPPAVPLTDLSTPGRAS